MDEPIRLHVRTRNMIGNAGDPVKNQFIIETAEGTFFQSYRTVIAFRAYNGKIYLDRQSWDCSITTGKYRNKFLGEDKRETERKIKNGTYELIDLNG